MSLVSWWLVDTELTYPFDTATTDCSAVRQFETVDTFCQSRTDRNSAIHWPLLANPEIDSPLPASEYSGYWIVVTVLVKHFAAPWCPACNWTSQCQMATPQG